MKKLLLAIAAISFVGTAASAATLGLGSTADCSTADVSISKGAGNDACVTAGGPGGSSLLARGQFDSFWTADFSSLQSMVSVDLGDFGSDADRLFLTAYSATDAVLASTTMDIASSFNGMKTLSVAAANISYVLFGSTGEIGLGGLFAQNLTFEGGVSEVPLPAGVLLLGTGLLGFGALRKRKA